MIEIKTQITLPDGTMTKFIDVVFKKIDYFLDNYNKSFKMIIKILSLVILLPICLSVICKYPTSVNNYHYHQEIYKYYAGFEFINLRIGNDCFMTDNKCTNRGSPGCATINGHRLYPVPNPDPYSFSTACGGRDYLTMDNIDLINGYRASINYLRLFIHCDTVCQLINATHYDSGSKICPIFE